MKRIYFLFLVLIAVSCNKNPLPLPKDHFITGIAMPLRLEKNQDSVILQDFVTEK
jgi:hypothetical protein